MGNAPSARHADNITPVESRAVTGHQERQLGPERQLAVCDDGLDVGDRWIARKKGLLPHEVDARQQHLVHRAGFTPVALLTTCPVRLREQVIVVNPQ